MKTDLKLQQDVIDQLKWEPILNAAEIGVSVKNGVVTLSGVVDTYAKKIAAEDAAKKIAGVKAVAEDIEVKIVPGVSRTDTEIAEAVVNALKWHASIPDEKIMVKVEDGVVTLDGEVDWAYQRDAAKASVENLTGVRMVLNSISVKPLLTTDNVKRKISAALHRSATLHGQNVLVDIIGNKVVLRGKVRSFSEAEDAMNAAWSAPGVAEVENDLEIEEAIEEPEFFE